jgi:hypothetical protein
MRATVVINTYNRAASLPTTLQALKYQTFEEFEVVVINGPSTDDTTTVLARWAEGIRIVECPEPRLSTSRNLGIAAACGDVVAFIDDDAIPEPDWLARIVATYDSGAVGAVGGYVYDETGFAFQWRYATCDRLGRVRSTATAPDSTFTAPGADRFLYAQGTNCSFRRDALVRAGGFDEALEHYYDDAEISMQIIDLGYELKILPQALVHHKSLGNRTRDQARVVVSPFAIATDHAYFAMRNGRGSRSRADVERSIQTFADGLCAAADANLTARRLTAEQHARFMREMAEGLSCGVTLALERPRFRRDFAPSDPGEFKPFPRLVAEGPRLHICVLSKECPPADSGGVGRYSYGLASGLARLGHVVHFITAGVDQNRIDFEDGMWLHRLVPWKRWVPELDDVPLQYNLYHVAAAYHEVCRIHERMPVDVVSAPLWLCEGLLCLLDERFPTVIGLQTAMKTIAQMHPSWSESTHITQLIALERAALTRARHLHANSAAILAKVQSEYDIDGAGAFVVPLGVEDRRAQFVRRHRDERVRVLFVSRLERRKGVDTFLAAAVRLLPELSRLEIVVVGKDTPNTEMAETYREAFVRAHGRDPSIAERVRFVGEVSEAELYQCYADADVFCVPSRYESFGLVYVEAMMFGMPIVATRVGGIPEVVQHEGNGLLVTAEDPEELADALRRLVVDDELRAVYGRRSRALYEERFTVPAMARSVAKEFHRVIGEHRAGVQAGVQAWQAA